QDGEVFIERSKSGDPGLNVYRMEMCIPSEGNDGLCHSEIYLLAYSQLSPNHDAGPLLTVRVSHTICDSTRCSPARLWRAGDNAFGHPKKTDYAPKDVLLYPKTDRLGC